MTFCSWDIDFVGEKNVQAHLSNSSIANWVYHIFDHQSEVFRTLYNAGILKSIMIASLSIKSLEFILSQWFLLLF